MELVFEIFLIWMMSAVSLGVGGSTLAIASFLVALQDKQIDPGERRMLGVIYWLLRSAMVMIVFTVGVVYVLQPQFLESAPFAAVLMIGLIGNAIAMTIKLAPVWFGPAFQAATWYTLGFIFAIEGFAIAELTWSLFAWLYLADVVFFLVVVNFAIWFFLKRTKATS